MKKIIIFLIVALFLSALTFVFYKLTNKIEVSSFAECKKAGYPIQESYPERCVTPDGKSFVNPDQVVPSQPISLTGELICLPHKQTDGPQTLECAFGLKSENGDNYAISDPQMKFVTAMTNGQKYRVTGLFLPETDSKYDIVGTIELITIGDLLNLN